MLGFHNLYTLLTENTKPGAIVNWYGGELTEKLIDMIDIVADGPVDERPLVTMYSEPVSPLSFRRENVESILRWTDAGLPLIWWPAQKPGATAPVTLAGATAQALAETLGGNVIAQLNNPGTPVILGVSPGQMDFRKGINVYYSAEMLLMQSASGQLGDYYDIPVFGLGGCTNAYSMDFDAGLESSISLYGSVLGGQNLIHDLGFAGRGDLGSLELLTLTDEMVGMLERSIDGMSVNGETLALDVIQNVDHGDNFLAERHTKEHGREALFMPELLDAVEESQWDDNRSVEQARERAKRLLAEAEPDPLPEDVQADLDAKMDEARDLAGELDRL
jgi:trimethylamine--corrinoid protein Co-methyltransferase